MKRKVVILPLDGYRDAAALYAALDELLAAPGLGDQLAYVKLNDGVHNDDAGGPAIVREIRLNLASGGFKAGIFLDLKINDVSATMENVLKKYVECPPDILTVTSLVSVEGIIKLRRLLPDTKLALLSMLTDIPAAECAARFGMKPEVKIYNDYMNISAVYKEKAEIPGEPFEMVVCSPHELPFLKKNLPASCEFIVPGIRDQWMTKKDEHQKRITGVKKALDMGATYVVMGARMTRGNPEKGISPAESRKFTEGEINAAKANVVVPGDPLATLKFCGGYYKSPFSEEAGRYVGPLVAYAGTYESGNGPKNYVGFEYFNFSRAESQPAARSYFAKLISEEIKKANLSCDVVIGAPMGGILLAGAIGKALNCRTIFAEKKVTALGIPADGIKEQSRQIIDRHEIFSGDNVVIVEDVCNNFSTTQKLKELIEEQGARVSGIVCAFNRSGKTEWNGLPVLSALYIPTEQFEQNDPQVFHLVEQGNIIWKPKVEWKKLLEAMEEE